MSDVIKMGRLFMDTLYLHGDRGNALALMKMADNFNNPLEVIEIDHESNGINFDEFDILYCPPGEIVSFPSIIDYLRPHLSELRSFLDKGKPMLVIGTSIAIFANKIIRCDGSEIEGLGLIDVICHEKESVYGDDICFHANFNGNALDIFGIQIQMIDIEILGGEPFGNLIYGYGNDGKSLNEGVIFNNGIFTNTLGPILVANPWLTKSIIELVLNNKEITSENIIVDFSLEKKSFDSKKEFVLSKKTNLTNCISNSNK